MNAKAFSLALFSVLIWGSSFAAIRVGLQGGYDAGQNVLVRFLIASALFLIFALWPGTKFRLPQKGDAIRILILGWIGISIYHIFVTFGMETISAGTAGMLVGSGPIFTALIAAFVLKERLTGLGWIGLGIGFIGILFIAFGSAGASLTLTNGALLVLIAAFASAIFFVFQKPLLTRYSAIELTAYFTWAGTLPFLIFSPGLFTAMQGATSEAHLATLYVGLFPAAIAYVTWATALSLANASSVSSLIYLEPAVAILVAWMWLHELPTPLSLIGGVIAIGGVMIVNLMGRKRRVLSGKTADSSL
ncbi:drug/metabolite transporter (DMT)-like permease [Planomicrobium stackebrandtii]|uniref:Drug/metabolite transporter (DMT)-like permease n=1 Tax=Planomicrobium stackebrandtii TaxID=253160 RepID=A0ABU0GTP6_9BACL|nr:DMT family transporter [Planomicrobium stackebrandtii]MDQ0428668.1 drug/metabolite transporter (DMT)-like permease [Planomicrobium stackebrandtii]